MVCNCLVLSNRTMEHHQKTILLLSQILVKYTWLMDVYNIDFFIDDHWSKLPKPWRDCIESLNFEGVEHILKTSNRLFPLSLLCLKKLSFMVQKLRKPLNDDDIPLELKTLAVKYFLPVKPETNSDHILCRGIKLKKRHEIGQLCKLIPPVMESTEDCSSIIDLGSGLGHLSRILSLCYGYPVHCVEANCDHLSGAVKKDHEILQALHKNKFTTKSYDEMPKKVNCFITEDHQIEQIVGGDDAKVGGHLLLGLHACGALSNLAIERFTSNINSRALILACCCYMKTGDDRFPMSSFLKHNQKFVLTYEGKELACHAIEKFIKKIESSSKNF